MTREILEQFQGRKNVIYMSDNGMVAYLSQIRSFADEESSLGTVKLFTFENEKIMFYFF